MAKNMPATDDEQVADPAPDPAGTPPTVDEAALRAKIEAEVRAEIAKEKGEPLVARHPALEGQPYYLRPTLKGMADKDLEGVLKTLGVKREGMDRDAMIEAILDRQGSVMPQPGDPRVGRKFKVTVHPTESEKGDIDVQVNGHNIRIQRGIEVVIAEPFLKALQNTVIESFVLDPEGKRDANGHPLRVPVRQPRYALSIAPA